MSYEEFKQKLLAIGINGINHFECEKCHNITPAYCLGRDYKPILKGLCEECAKQEFRQEMIQKRDRYPDCEYWMHIIEYTPSIRKLEEKDEAMRNGTYKCPDCKKPCRTPLCEFCHKKLLEKLEKEEHKNLIQALERIKQNEKMLQQM